MRVTRKRVVVADVEAIEALWYDVNRWPEWVDGLKEVESVGGEWPDEGGSVIWRSGPHGRGEVRERVTSHVRGSGQIVDFDDDSMSGSQELALVPDPGKNEVRINLTFDYRVKGAGPIGRVINVLFVRSYIGGMLQRTLDRFAATLQARE